MEKIFHFKEYSASHVGEQTLGAVEAEVRKYRKKHPKAVIYLDFAETSIMNTYLSRVASICEYHNCKVIGLDGREHIVTEMQESGFFVMEHIGVPQYVEKLKCMVELADYPLMIKDSRRDTFYMQGLKVIQPINFTDTEFIYHEIRSPYTQPFRLTQALKEGRTDIFIRSSVYLTDINATDMCFRFATSNTERTMLDLLSGILMGTIDESLFNH